MDVVTREEAIWMGQAWFFTGKPCKHGHVAKRNVANYVCRDCAYGRTKVEKEEQERRRHQQWLADFRKRRAQRIADGKQRLDLASQMLS